MGEDRTTAQARAGGRGESQIRSRRNESGDECGSARRQRGAAGKRPGALQRTQVRWIGPRGFDPCLPRWRRREPLRQMRVRDGEGEGAEGVPILGERDILHRLAHVRHAVVLARRVHGVVLAGARPLQACRFQSAMVCRRHPKGQQQQCDKMEEPIHVIEDGVGYKERTGRVSNLLYRGRRERRRRELSSAAFAGIAGGSGREPFCAGQRISALAVVDAWVPPRVG